MATQSPPKKSPRSRVANLYALTKDAKKRTFRSGKVIFREGDSGDSLYVIESGGVEISVRVGTSEARVLSRFGPREYFGEMAVIDSQSRSATATAKGATVVRVVSRGKIWRMFRRSPELLVAMMREFSLRMRSFDRRYIDCVLQQERLALLGRFAQSIVHDFRNPLNTIGIAGSLACAEDATREERSEASAAIRKQVNRLASMIGEVLEFTHPSRNPAALEKTGFREFVEDLVSDLKKDAAERAVTIALKNRPPDISLPIDGKRLPRVFINLVANAIDFMPRGGRITLRFKVSRNFVITEVADTGPGIAPAIVGRIFEPFASYGKSNGTGLGLSICKRIIEDHGGTICAGGRAGRGAVFTVSLPRGRK